MGLSLATRYICNYSYDIVNTTGVITMDRQIERARELLPSIIITVLSMIQALALELYWTRIQASDLLWQGGWTAALGWLQLAVILVGILLVWLLYVGLVLRFRWLPTMEDTLIPFAIGLLEFSMIDLMGPDTLGPWFLALAGVFALCIGATHVVHRRARRDSENDYFFSQVAPAGWRDYAASIVVICVLALFGLALWNLQSNHILELAALLFALAALSYQMLQSHRYWMHTLIQPATAEKSGAD